MSLEKQFEGEEKDKDRDTAVIERPPCPWKEMASDPDSTTFQRIKSNPENEFNQCLSCNGYKMKCEEYLSYLNDLSAEF